jgi:hypothetical protein
MGTQGNLFELRDNATRRMEQRFLAGAQQEAALIASVQKMVIVDKLVAPSTMKFSCYFDMAGLRLDIGETGLSIHKHAFSQLCSKVGFPLQYAGSLLNPAANETYTTVAWRRELAAHNLNELFARPKWTEKNGAQVRFLHRIVGNELRGFLSRRYNRYLASVPLLRAFVEACRASGARPVEAVATDVRVSLKCLLPEVYEAFPGEYVCMGVEWSNSDFGAGKLSVCMTLWRVASATSTVLDQTISRIHIGSVIEESDLELSEDTLRKEVIAQQGAIGDAVKEQLSERVVTKLVEAVRVAHEEKIPWSKLKTQLSRFLGKADVESVQNLLDGKGETIIDLPPISFEGSERVANLWWAASVVGNIANKVDDLERKLELQREAGKLFGSVVGK